MTSSPVTSKTATQTGPAPPQPRRFSFEEYCAYDDGTDNRYELVQGYLRLMSPPAGLHIVICAFLEYVFNQLFVKTRKSLRAGREVGVRIHENTCRIVDVCVNGEDCWQQISQPGEIGIFLLAQTPLLVVEVTSTNETEDYDAKYQEYAAIGILECWIVSSRRQQVRICNLTQRSTTYQYRDFGQGERIVSRVLPQLILTVDEVLDPPAVTQLMAQERAAFEAEKGAIAAERDQLKRSLEQLKASIESSDCNP